MTEFLLTIQFILANPLSGVNSTLQPYFTAFAERAGTPEIRIPAGFADLDGVEIGVCIMIRDQRWIYIDKEFWESASPIQRQAIINHELGHCALGLDHDTAHEGGCPSSLMFPQLMPESCLTKYPERYTPEALAAKAAQ